MYVVFNTARGGTFGSYETKNAAAKAVADYLSQKGNKHKCLDFVVYDESHYTRAILYQNSFLETALNRLCVTQLGSPFTNEQVTKFAKYVGRAIKNQYLMIMRDPYDVFLMPKPREFDKCVLAWFIRKALRPRNPEQWRYAEMAFGDAVSRRTKNPKAGNKRVTWLEKDVFFD